MEPQHDLEFGARVEEHVGAPSGITIASAGIAGLAASVLALSLAVNMLRGSLGQAPAAAGLTAFCAAIGAAYVALIALQSRRRVHIYEHGVVVRGALATLRVPFARVTRVAHVNDHLEIDLDDGSFLVIEHVRKIRQLAAMLHHGAQRRATGTSTC